MSYSSLEDEAHRRPIGEAGWLRLGSGPETPPSTGEARSGAGVEIHDESRSHSPRGWSQVRVSSEVSRSVTVEWLIEGFIAARQGRVLLGFIGGFRCGCCPLVVVSPNQRLFMTQAFLHAPPIAIAQQAASLDSR